MDRLLNRSLGLPRSWVRPNARLASESVPSVISVKRSSPSGACSHIHTSQPGRQHERGAPLFLQSGMDPKLAGINPGSSDLLLVASSWLAEFPAGNPCILPFMLASIGHAATEVPMVPRMHCQCRRRASYCAASRDASTLAGDTNSAALHWRAQWSTKIMKIEDMHPFIVKSRF